MNDRPNANPRWLFNLLNIMRMSNRHRAYRVILGNRFSFSDSLLLNLNVNHLFECYSMEVVNTCASVPLEPSQLFTNDKLCCATLWLTLAFILQKICGSFCAQRHCDTLLFENENFCAALGVHTNTNEFLLLTNYFPFHSIRNKN